MPFITMELLEKNISVDQILLKKKLTWAYRSWGWSEKNQHLSIKIILIDFFQFVIF